MKKKLMLIFGVIMLFTCFAVSAFAAVDYSGDFDGGLHYSIDTTTGVLTISGTGPMQNRTSASGYPFNDYKGYIESIVIGDGVSSIGDYAFSNYTLLRSITIPGSVKTIGNNALSRCTKLETVTLAEGIEEIGDYAFSIGSLTNALTEINLPASLKSIGKYAFSGANIESISIPGGVSTISTGTFYQCSKLTEVVLNEGVKTLDEKAFEYCNTKKIVLPESIETIGRYAFSKCYYLTEINIPSKVNELPEGAFLYCRELTELTIPGTVEIIKEQCFYLSGISVLRFPSGAPKAIYSNAFQGLEVVILYDRSKGDFSGYTGSKFGATSAAWSSGELGSGGTSWDYHDQTLYINGSGAMPIFTGTSPGPWTPLASSMKKLVISDGVTDIGAYSFKDCHFTSVVIPDSVTYIGEKAFYGCDWLKVMGFEGNLPHISGSLFSGSGALDLTVFYQQDTEKWKNWYSDQDFGYSKVRLSGDKAFPVWVCGKKISFDEMSDLYEDAIQVRKDVVYSILNQSLIIGTSSLTGYSGSGTELWDTSVIYAAQKLTIVLENENVTLTASNADISCGIAVDGSLIITGANNDSLSCLNVNSGNSADNTANYGIKANSLTLSGCSLYVNGYAAQSSSAGVFLTGDYPSYAPPVLILTDNSVLSAEAGPSEASDGIYMIGGMINVDEECHIYATGFRSAFTNQGGKYMYTDNSGHEAFKTISTLELTLPEGYAVFGGASGNDSDKLTLQSEHPYDPGEDHIDHYMDPDMISAKYLYVDVAPIYYDIYVCGKRLNDHNIENYIGLEFTPSTDDDIAVLSMNDCVIESSRKTGEETRDISAIYYPGDLDIVVNGSNEITGPDSPNSESSFGIYVGGSLTITSGGSLIFTGGSPMTGSSDRESYGINVSENLYVMGSGLSVTGMGGNVSGATNNFSCGVSVGCDIVVEGAELNAIARDGSVCYGLITSAENFTIDKGGKVYAESLFGRSCNYGTYLMGTKLFLTNGVLTIDGDDYGLYFYGDGDIADSTQTLVALGLHAHSDPELTMPTKDVLAQSEFRHVKIISVGDLSLSQGTVKYSVPAAGVDYSVGVFVAQYVDGRMTDIRYETVDLNSGAANRSAVFSDIEGAEYRLFVAGGSEFAPCCRARRLE